MINTFKPLIVRSWTILSEETFVKRLDKSSFLHRGNNKLVINLKELIMATKQKLDELQSIKFES